MSFRGRLTWLIATAFVIGGIGLLAAQYAMMAGFFSQQLHTSTISVGNATPPAGAGSGDTRPGVATSGELTTVRDEVLRNTLLGSLALVVVLAVAAAALAWWLSGRLVARIGDVTRLASDISASDLTRRLALPGPPDEITALGDTFDAMLERLQDGFQRQERFVANASHELRTPLAAARTALEAPLLQGRFDPAVVPDVRRALAANQHSEQLIAALLQLARAGQGLAESGPVELDEVVHGVLAEQAGAIAAKSLDVEVSLAPAEVIGDQTMLIRAVTNLIENAVKYTAAGETIRVAQRLTETGVELVVDNPGRSFSVAEASGLIEPFRRGERSSPAPGNGLGLAIVDAVARAHGGGLQVTPRDGGGLRARLQLSRESAA